MADWVRGCPGLGKATTAGEAIPIVVDYFLENFSYDLGKGTDPGEPLDTFMEERMGHCTLFALGSVVVGDGSGMAFVADLEAEEGRRPR